MTTLINEATGGVVTVGAAATIDVIVRKDGEVVDLTNKTVTATVRAANNDQAVVHADLEGFATTLQGAEAGVVRVELTAALTAHLEAPANVTQTRGHYLQLVVTDDGYAPNPVKFNVRRAAATLGG